jgi:hypothetical protein
MQGWAIFDFERVSSVEFLDLQRLLLSLYPSVATRGKNMKIAHATLLAATIFAMACSAGRTAAQQNTHVERPVIPARTEDVSTIEGIVKASYDAISGGVGVPRNWGRDRTLFDPESRSVAVEVDSKTGAITTKAKSEQDFADEADAWMVKNGFTERELAHVIKRYGNVATVLSSYEGKTAAGKVVSRGVNIFQLYFDGKRWWILSMVWDEERPNNPIPPELL